MKRPGYCSLCEQPVFEILQEENGEPIRIGKPTGDAWRATFLLSNETECDLTFCVSCLARADERKDEIWRKVIEREEWALEHGQSNERQVDFVKSLKPLKVIRHQAWSDL